MIDLLAISHAAFTAVNRAVYRELARRGWDVEIVIPSEVRFPGGARTPDAARPGDPPLHLCPTTRGGPRLSTFAGLRRLLKERRPRLILLDNDPNSRIAVELGLWARRHGAKLVCQSCENLPRGLRPSARRTGARGVASAALIAALGAAARPNVAHVFVISEGGREVLTGQGYRSVSRIPLGFDPALFRPDEALRAATRERLGLTEPTVAYFGRVNRQKGIHLLVEALAGLQDRPFQLLLDAFHTYRDPYEAELTSQIAREGLTPRLVRFDAKHDEMPAYMNAADVVVIPSTSTPTWREQYGRVAPEAMACGRAVVVSDSGALPELVGEAGVVVPEGDVPALRAAIAELLADGDRRAELGAAAHARAHAELDLRRQADLMEEVFTGLSGQSKLAPASP